MLITLHGQGSEEPILLSYQAWNQWLRGYPDQALQTMEQALQLAQPHDHIQSYTLLSSQCFTLLSSATLHQWRREPDTAYPQIEASIALADKVGVPLFRSRGLTLQGWVLVQRGQREEGIALIRRGINDYRAYGVDLFSTFILAMLAALYGQTGEIQAGLNTITEALDLAYTYDERWWEADLHRLQAELMLQLDEPDASQAEAALHQALTVAREQEAKSLELRAATRLGRLWYQQGKGDQAHRLVEDIYSWFTEGHDTADLKDAREFLSA
jgi:predicted ATPase